VGKLQRVVAAARLRRTSSQFFGKRPDHPGQGAGLSRVPSSSGFTGNSAVGVVVAAAPDDLDGAIPQP